MDEARRMAMKGTIFSTWVVLGLFLDGWAHNAGKPETFWTPWHAVLYSGFAVAAVSFARDRRRRRHEGTSVVTDPLMVAGFVLFAIAGVGDAIWHSVFGIEEDVAALLSPTHLLLMVGGLLLIGGPLRTRHHEGAAGEVGWRAGLPDVLAITLALAVVGFFLQFLSPFHGIHARMYGAGSTETGQLLGVASVLTTNVLFVAAAAFAVARRDLLPAGTLTVVLGGAAVLLSSLEGFEGVELVAAAVAAGVVADVLTGRGVGSRSILMSIPAVLWLGWFGIYDVRWGLGWPAEYWTGATVLAILTGWGLDLLSQPAADATGLALTAASASAQPEEGPHVPPLPATAGVGYSRR